MNIITVNASRKYEVHIGNNILSKIGAHAAALTKAKKAAIISDSNVFPLYGKTVKDSLTAEGFEVVSYTFPAGEESKNGENYLSILNFLAENKLTRADLLIALGGGVVGDITGFAAATYLRGIAYIQVPTSLLAMVDSSVGGKTAIDLPAGKNLAGAFYQPHLVLCDTNCLNTLPLPVLIDGSAEVIKYGVLYDPELFGHLEKNGLDFDRIAVVSRCVELKRDVVANDEFDTGERQKLNLGHTIGHGIEKESDFSISHGKAVAMGMAIVSKAAVNSGICSCDVYDKITAILRKFQLPTYTDCTAENLFDCALSDKKRSGGSVNLIIPKNIGECIIQPTDISELLPFIKAGL